MRVHHHRRSKGRPRRTSTNLRRMKWKDHHRTRWTFLPRLMSTCLLRWMWTRHRHWTLRALRRSRSKGPHLMRCCGRVAKYFGSLDPQIRVTSCLPVRTVGAGTDTMPSFRPKSASLPSQVQRHSVATASSRSRERAMAARWPTTVDPSCSPGGQLRLVDVWLSRRESLSCHILNDIRLRQRPRHHSQVPVGLCMCGANLIGRE